MKGGGLGAPSYHGIESLVDTEVLKEADRDLPKNTPNPSPIYFRVLCLCALHRSSKPDLIALPRTRRRRTRNTYISISLKYVRNVLLLVLVHQLAA